MYVCLLATDFTTQTDSVITSRSVLLRVCVRRGVACQRGGDFATRHVVAANPA